MIGIVVLIFRVLLVVALYLFLGVVLFSLWKQLMGSVQRSNPSEIPHLSLEPKGFDGHSRIFEKQSVISIGRNQRNDIHFEDAELSNHHAEIRYHHNQWWVEDSHSTNGTFINGEKIKDPIVLVSEDILRCGFREWKIIIETKGKAR